jgi:type IV secretory pathway VirJ component
LQPLVAELVAGLALPFLVGKLRLDAETRCHARRTHGARLMAQPQALTQARAPTVARCPSLARTRAMLTSRESATVQKGRSETGQGAVEPSLVASCSPQVLAGCHRRRWLPAYRCQPQTASNKSRQRANQHAQNQMEKVT